MSSSEVYVKKKFIQKISKRKGANLVVKKLFGVGLAVLLFITMYVGLPESFDWSSRVMVAIVASGVILWALEPIPLGLTAMLILILMLIFKVVSTEVVYSGFASPAVFLIIGGMMLARAVNETPIAKRTAYFMMAKWGGNAKGLLASILLIPQIQAFFIPAAAVRTALLIPIALNALDTVGAQPNSNLRKMILLAVAFGGTISGTAVMTAAIGNILTVELLNSFLNIKITYFQWFLYAFPLWLALIPTTWVLLLKLFPLKEEERFFPHAKNELKQRLREFGPMDWKEKRCLLILIFTVALWMSEPFYGLHPSIPALIGVLLMTLPGMGCASWSHVVKVNFNTVLLLGTTLSMGYALNESGATVILGKSLSTPWIFSMMQKPIIAVIFILCITQIFHLAISNVSTAVVTLIPIYIGLSLEVGADPILICFTASLACLHGYILVVESMPNVLVHSTGQISQREYLLPGIYITLLMTGLTALMALTWWQWVGLI